MAEDVAVRIPSLQTKPPMPNPGTATQRELLVVQHLEREGPSGAERIRADGARWLASATPLWRRLLNNLLVACLA